MPKVSQEPIEGERWLPIAGYEGFYEVSDHGRVRSLDRVIEGGKWGHERRKGMIMAGGRCQKGYPQILLRKNGTVNTRKIHQLVLETFVGPCPPGLEGCHWDDDHTNNRLDNLRWANRSDNCFDKVRNGHHVLKNRTHCPRNHPLIEGNIVPAMAKKGYRTCWACARAYDDGRTAVRNGAKNVDMYATSDAHFAKLMKLVNV